MLPYNGKIDEYSQLYAQLGQVTILDLIKSHNDRKDLEDRLKMDIADLKNTVLAMSKLMGYVDKYSLEQAARETTILSDKKVLLKMDRSGNIWLNGVLENNPTRIGKEIVKIAQSYRENLPIGNMSEYLNNTSEEPFDDTPF